MPQILERRTSNFQHDEKGREKKRRDQRLQQRRPPLLDERMPNHHLRKPADGMDYQCKLQRCAVSKR